MRPRQLRWRLILAGFGAVLAGATIGTGIARADINVCFALHASPTVGTVEELALGFIADGWTAREAGEIIARSVVGGCPQYSVVLERFVAAYSPTQPISSGVGGRLK